jgi:hypothetical protein
MIAGGDAKSDQQEEELINGSTDQEQLAEQQLDSGQATMADGDKE